MAFLLILFGTGMMCIQGLPNQKYTATFDLHVDEKGALFDQNIKTDIINNVIYYHTPAHNEIDEMYKVQDFKQNIEVSCYPFKMECYKMSLDLNVYQDAAHTSESLLIGHRTNGNHVSSRKQTNVFIKKWYKKSIIKDLGSLGSKSTVDFVEGFGFTLYETELVPDNADFLDINNTTEHRQKGKFIPASKCIDNTEPAKKYGYTHTHGCDYLNVCDDLKCEETHVQDLIYWVCLCCPYHYTISDCFSCSQL